MKIVLCSVPGEPVHFEITSDVRALGHLPVLPKFGITALARWMWKSGYQRSELEFFDMDMLLPTDAEIHAFFATRQGFISPESFTFSESAVILAIVVLGGMGSFPGAFLGALVLGVIESTAGYLTTTQIAEAVIYITLLGMLLLRPQGFFGLKEA